MTFFFSLDCIERFPFFFFFLNLFGFSYSYYIFFFVIFHIKLLVKESRTKKKDEGKFCCCGKNPTFSFPLVLCIHFLLFFVLLTLTCVIVTTSNFDSASREMDLTIFNKSLSYVIVLETIMVYLSVFSRSVYIFIIFHNGIFSFFVSKIRGRGIKRFTFFWLLFFSSSENGREE